MLAYVLPELVRDRVPAPALVKTFAPLTTPEIVRRSPLLVAVIVVSAPSVTGGADHLRTGGGDAGRRAGESDSAGATAALSDCVAPGPVEGDGVEVGAAGAEVDCDAAARIAESGGIDAGKVCIEPRHAARGQPVANAIPRPASRTGPGALAGIDRCGVADGDVGISIPKPGFQGGRGKGEAAGDGSSAADCAADGAGGGVERTGEICRAAGQGQAVARAPP